MSRKSPFLLAFLWSGAALADGAPFMDADFTRRSADNDPDLIVVREGYDPERRVQSLYLRAHDGTPDVQVFSGVLRVRGAVVDEVIFAADDLAASDARWGLPDADYGPGDGRGLEGNDPTTAVPRQRRDVDAVRRPNAATVRFWFSTGADVDDLRVLVRYDREPGPASLDVELFRPHGDTDPLGFPPTDQGGVQVGSLTDATPDDGDYSEVFAVESIKLRIEDVDLVEETVDLGAIPLGGGIAGPAFVAVDNGAGGLDLDQDNGFDQNGLISPIPAVSDLEHLRWSAGPLTDERGNVVSASRVRLANAPVRLPVGQMASVRVTIEVGPATPPGRYEGRLTVWEDNDGDRLRARSEPQDEALLVVRVGDVLDAAVAPDGGAGDGGARDGGVADGGGGPGPADGGAPGDGGSIDAAPGDSGTGADGGGAPADGGGTPGRDGGQASADAGEAAFDLGDARGGALGCRAAEGGGPLLLLPLALAYLRRRRAS